MSIRPRDIWWHLLVIPIIIGVIWLGTLAFPDAIKIADFGSLVVSGSLYLVLITVLLLLVLSVSMAICRWSMAIAICAFCSLFAGIPVLLIMNELVNGFWIGDAFVAALISIFSSVIVVGYELVIFKRH